MDKLKLTVGVEPKNKYEKAKQDLLQAWKSFGELTPTEREVLVSEVIGAEKVAAVKAIFGVRLTIKSQYPKQYFNEKFTNGFPPPLTNSKQMLL